MLCILARHLPRALPKDYKRVLHNLDTTVSGQNVNKPLHYEMFWAEAKPPAPVPRERCFCLASETGWLGHCHRTAGCASRPWQDGNLSLLLHKCETLFSSFMTTVYPAPQCWGSEAHTHFGLYYHTFCTSLPQQPIYANLGPIKSKSWPYIYMRTFKDLLWGSSLSV